jgi:hypothetical protein
MSLFALGDDSDTNQANHNTQRNQQHPQTHEPSHWLRGASGSGVSAFVHGHWCQANQVAMISVMLRVSAELLFLLLQPDGQREIMRFEFNVLNDAGDAGRCQSKKSWSP